MRNRLNEGINRIQNIMYGSINEQNVSGTNFNGLADKIITEIEGGYYHPDMLKDGRIKDSRYGASGETMFGMDRRTGSVYVSTPEGKEFWSIIDSSGARKSWPWNTMGGVYETKLRTLAIKMIQKEFNRLLAKYITDKNITDLVNKSVGLTFNFIYATWNGEGYFRQMAKLLVDNYNSGIVDPNKLIDNQISFRLNHSNSLIKQSGEKMRDIINKNNYKSAPYMGQDDPGEDISAGLKIINNLYSAAMGQKA
jgi:hypothetical protein